MSLIGANSAGKSTTIRILMGLVYQGSGEAELLGYRMPAQQVIAKQDIGFASEDMLLYDSMTLGWHMHFMQAIYSNWDAACSQLLLKRFGLRPEDQGTVPWPAC
jgi:ABC-2 type transport system ATP-binding protein